MKIEIKMQKWCLYGTMFLIALQQMGCSSRSADPTPFSRVPNSSGSNNSNTNSTSANVVFYSTVLNPGSITVSLSGVNIGTFSPLYYSYDPGCTGFSGTLSYKSTINSYQNYTARSANGYYWSGSVYVSSGYCNPVELDSLSAISKPVRTGNITFFRASSSVGGSYIDVYLNGVSRGRITSSSIGTPTCSSSGFVTISNLTAGSYYNWYAVGQNGSRWNTSSTNAFSIYAGSCTTFQLY